MSFGFKFEKSQSLDKNLKGLKSTNVLVKVNVFRFEDLNVLMFKFQFKSFDMKALKNQCLNSRKRL
jgi:hypothetical protein